MLLSPYHFSIFYFEDPDIYVGNMGRAFKEENQSEDRKLNSKKL